MIIYKCDVCEKTEDAPTMGDSLDRMLPLGWFKRTGRVPCAEPKGLVDGRPAYFCHEVVVHACSADCCAAYDKREVERVGLPWQKSIYTTHGAEGLVSVRALSGKP